MPRLILLIAMLTVFRAGLVVAQPSPKTQALLIGLEVHSDSIQETILLKFQSPFGQIPSLNFDKGIVSITLPQTSLSLAAKDRVVNDRFLKSLSMASEGTSAILEIVFADSDFDATERISYQAVEDGLNITIQKTGKISLLPAEPLPTVDSNQALSIRNPSLINHYFTDNELTINIVKMLLALFFLLLLFYALLWAYNRFVLRRLKLKQGKYSIRVSSSYHLNPKQRIVVVEVNDAAYACGITPSQINVIAKVSGSSFTDFLSRLQLSPQAEVNFAELRTQYLASKQAETTKQVVEPMAEGGFATELIGRIKKLKPLD